MYSNGTMTSLGTFGGLSSYAVGINKDGQVVGAFFTGGPVGQLAFLSSNGTTTTLGTLGGITTVANAINNAGQVVGLSTLSPNSTASHAFLYSHESLIDLNSLLDASGKGWTLEVATAINNNGQIVGFGVNPFGNSEAFLLTPVPIPGAVWLFGSGLLTLLGWRARTA